MIWTFRDVRERSRDIFVQLLSVLLVVIFNIPGLLLYFLLRPGETLASMYERELSEEALLQDIEEKQACPACQQKVQPDFLYCPNCHTRLKRRCDNCHRIAESALEYLSVLRLAGDGRRNLAKHVDRVKRSADRRLTFSCSSAYSTIAHLDHVGPA